MLLYWVWFAQLKTMNLLQKHQLLRMFSDPKEIYLYAGGQKQGMTEKLQAALENKDLGPAQRILKECEQKGIQILCLEDALYPARLRNTADAPLVLYVAGRIPDWTRQPVIGIVGTRRATNYGLTMAARFGAHIAVCGGLVISGGAAGVDTEAMQAALDMGKPVVGVLGCGVDVVYPAKNKAMFAKVTEKGCLISEYPPRTPGNAWQFPARNRIISGISNGVVLIEAPLKSGSLNTAQHAMEQGRDIFVVPGNLDMETFSGSNLLLRDGAVPVTGGWDVMKDYAPLWPDAVSCQPEPPMEKVAPKTPAAAPKPAGADKKPIDKQEKSTYSVLDTAPLSDTEKKLLELIGQESVYMDSLVEEMDISARELKGVLTKLSIKGLVVMLPGGRVCRK